MLFFRVDMNETIATGHVMRCLAIAEAGKDLGEDSTFVLADINADELIRSKGFKTIVLNTQWSNMESELPVLSKIIEEHSIETLLVDSYYATNSYLSELKKRVRLIYIDDLYEEKYPVDVVINYDGCVLEQSYREKYKDVASVLFGYDYVPLRKMFSYAPEKKFDNTELTLLIMSGGSDSLHAIKGCLEGLEFSRFGKVIAICGRYNEDYDMLLEKYRDDERIEVLRNVDNIYQYMVEADMCISAAGNTIYELAACGTPTILFAASKEQINAAKFFEECGLAPFCGLFSEEIIEKINRILVDYSKDYLLREKISKKIRKLVDGHGSKRIAKAMLDTKAQ